MNKKENYLRAVRFERPDYIPMTFGMNDACYQAYPQEALFELMEQHPLLFPDFQKPALPEKSCRQVTSQRKRSLTRSHI